MLEDSGKVRSWLINFKHLSLPWTNSIKVQSLQTTSGAYVHSIYMLGCMKRIVQPQIPLIHGIPFESLRWVGSVPQMEVQSVVLSLK